MCGLMGVMSSKLTFQDCMKAKDLFTLAQLRGDDGAGMIGVPKKDGNVQHVRVRRTTWSSGHFVTTSDYDDMTKGDMSILVGHARQPTKGGSKLENVHPHHAQGTEGDIYLVHNGTMHTVDDASLGQNESDSKKLTRVISEKGLQHFVDSSFGAYCLIWVDLKTQTLNFLRNSQRPLFFAEQYFTPGSSTLTHLWWASELWMIQMALSRYSGFRKEEFKYYQLPENEHWSFPLNVGMSIAKPEIKKVERTYKPSTHYLNAWDGWEDADQEQSVVPFRQNNSSASGGDKQSSTHVVTTSAGNFRYTPPEYRQPGQDGPSRSIWSPARILAQSRDNAQTATIAAQRKEAEERLDATNSGSFSSAMGGSQATSTQTTREVTLPITHYAEKNRKRVLELVSNAPCVWCNCKPSFVGTNIPNIYPVRFTETRGEYVCHGCISDLDVQRMVGVA